VNPPVNVAVIPGEFGEEYLCTDTVADRKGISLVRKVTATVIDGSVLGTQPHAAFTLTQVRL